MVEFFIAAMELLEAEGRVLRYASVRLGWALGLIVLTILLAALGGALCLWGFYHFLATALGVPAAGLLTGLSALLGAGVTARLAARVNR